jgi:X-domain of DnaJ-containing
MYCSTLPSLWCSIAYRLNQTCSSFYLQVYNLAAIQFIGSAESGIGMPSIGKWAANQKAKLDSKSEKNKNQMETLRTGIGMMGLQQKFMQRMQEASTDEEKAAIQEEMESAMSITMLKILWTTTVVDVTNTLYEAIQMVLFDQSVDKATRERRAHGLKKLGEIFMECPEPVLGENEEEKDAKKLYEEAAFAAMLETIKRKEDAQQTASFPGH